MYISSHTKHVFCIVLYIILFLKGHIKSLEGNSSSF